LIIVGELINGTRAPVAEAIAGRDAGRIGDLARRQVAAGATYVDINSGRVGDDEVADLAWLAETVRAATDAPLSLDSATPAAIAAGLAACEGGPSPIINSVTLEEERLAAVLPMALGSGASVIALAIDDAGMPADAAQRSDTALRLIERLAAEGVAGERVFVDPVVTPLGTGHDAAAQVCEAIRTIREEATGCHVICGLSNVSFGLPRRALLNRVFLAQAIFSGLDAAILDPLDDAIMQTVYAAEALAGRDEWCMNYIAAYRDGRLG
jgi:5-methyltetrahydrofolate--homocysteine methyltransferase